MLLTRMRLFVVFAVLAGLMCSCATAPLVGSLSPQAAQREAHRDIQSGHMKLYLAGTRGVYTVGVEAADLPLVKGLPRLDTLPSGCTDPNANAGITYAEAYNQEIVRYLRSHPHPEPRHTASGYSR